MCSYVMRGLAVLGVTVWLVLMLSCAHDQVLQSIQIQPAAETFGATNIPVNLDAGAAVQLRALGTYIHPPVTKDITDQVTWASDTPQMVTVNSTGLITATGGACGTTVISATVKTNSDASGRSSSGAIVTGSMNANVTCFTGTSNGTAILSIEFLGSGTGTVSVSPSGFICTATCSLAFPVNSGPITLTAATNGTFGGWGNCPAASGTNGTVCTINSITTDVQLTATFN